MKLYKPRDSKPGPHTAIGAAQAPLSSVRSLVRLSTSSHWWVRFKAGQAPYEVSELGFGFVQFHKTLSRSVRRRLQRVSRRRVRSVLHSHLDTWKASRGTWVGYNSFFWKLSSSGETDFRPLRKQPVERATCLENLVFVVDRGLLAFESGGWIFFFFFLFVSRQFCLIKDEAGFFFLPSPLPLVPASPGEFRRPANTCSFFFSATDLNFSLLRLSNFFGFLFIPLIILPLRALLTKDSSQKKIFFLQFINPDFGISCWFISNKSTSIHILFSSCVKL